MADMEYYETLGVQPSSSQEDIVQAFRRLAREVHPDMNAGANDPDAAARFKRISEAYHVLSDPNQRARYDLERGASAAGHAVSAEANQGAQEGQPLVVQRTVSVHSAQVESTLDDLRSALADAASEAADELRGALRDFAADLNAEINTLTRAASGDGHLRRPQRRPPPAARRSSPRKRR